MNISFVKLTETYKKEVIDIFNYFVENTTSAYRAEKVSYDFFENLIDEDVVTAYAILNEVNTVIGFCTLEKYKNISTFSDLGDCMYFIKPEMTGKGIGKNTLSVLEKDAMQNGIKKIVVDISDENEKSIEFHKKNGFVEYGRLEKCWKKFGRDVGIVYMYKNLR
jgi:phosphinothricin acetyltransferase